MKSSVHRAAIAATVAVIALGGWPAPASAQSEYPDSVRQQVDVAVAKVKPALVRISVVSTGYSEGREWKFEATGSGAIITPEGHVITNHHVAGRATRLKCTLATKEEVDAELVGKDPLTDIAVIKLLPKSPRTFPVATFGDSSLVEVGDRVLAMGSPMSLSQSVTLGIVSNTELVLPEWMSQFGGLQQEGEDVGSLVRWLGHDASIYGGNSGGPLVNLEGEIIGINEISIGLGGAIPGNLAKDVAESLIKEGTVKRAWMGFGVQPRLKSSEATEGILIGSVLKETPAAEAGFEPGDLLVKLAGETLDVRFAEQVPGFNKFVSDLTVGEPIEAVVLRNGTEKTLTVTPRLREEVAPPEHEIKEWGATMRDISFIAAKELKRDNRDGVIVTTVRPGGPLGEAKPRIQPRSIIVSVNDEPVKNLDDLRRITGKLWQDDMEPVPALVTFDYKQERFVTIVNIGITELADPAREVSKAWLPIESQVLTRDIAENMGDADLSGFRVTHVYEGMSAAEAGIEVGDIILEVDGFELLASAPEEEEELPTLIRQYEIGTEAELAILRKGERQKLLVKLIESPKTPREMAKYEDKNFEFTVRDITFFDKAREKIKESVRGVMVEEVTPGGWAALGNLSVGDFVLDINGEATPSVEALGPIMENLETQEPDTVVIRVLRGIHTLFLELEPKWDGAN